MSQQQLDAIIADVQACFGAWTDTTTLDEMRRDWDAVFKGTDSGIGCRFEDLQLGGVRAQQVVAPGAAADRAILYLHGGGYAFGSPRSHRDLAEHLSRAAQAVVYVLDYRLAPENPHPAAVDDAVSAYRALLERHFAPARLALCGDSAGGGLSVATLLSLKTLGLPLPACAGLLSPWVDLEATGDSMVSKDAEDPIVHKPMIDQLARMYLPTGSLRQPLVSPLYGEIAGLPPLLIHAGSRETLLDDSTRLWQRAQAAGVDVKLDVWPGMIHVWHIFASRLDEGARALEQIGAFVRRHTG